MQSGSYSNIGEVQNFKAEDFPFMISELAELVTMLTDTSVYYRRDIVISYLKDHKIKTEWIDANPTVAEKMLSGKLKTQNLEALFESCKWNKAFRNAYETYIKSKVN